MFKQISKQAKSLYEAVLALGLSYEALDCSQIILAAAKGATAEISCYENKQGDWEYNETLGIMSGFIGKNGVSANKREGDGCTPAGLFRLGSAFGNKEKPETKMPYRIVTENSFWVDDPKSGRYNTWVEGLFLNDWDSAEHLAVYKDSYAYAVVIEYNTLNILPEKGSAIFLHCGFKPTSGCVALPEAQLLKILKWFEPEKLPGILITEG